MNGWQVSPRLAVRLGWCMISFVSVAALEVGLPAAAQDKIEQVRQTEAAVDQRLGLNDAEGQFGDLNFTLLPKPVRSPEPVQLSDIDQSATTVADWIAQLKRLWCKLLGCDSRQLRQACMWCWKQQKVF